MALLDADPFHAADVLGTFVDSAGTRYENVEVDSLLERARVEPDEAQRWALYADAERLILSEAPWLPLYTGVETWLVAPYVHGFTLPPIVLPRMAAR